MVQVFQVGGQHFLGHFISDAVVDETDVEFPVNPLGHTLVILQNISS